MTGPLAYGLAAAAVILVAQGSGSLPPKPDKNPEVHVHWHYYPIRGVTSAELKQQMRENGKEGWWGYAEWYVQWSRTCQVTVSIDYTLPKWENEGEAPVELQDAWNSMLANLAMHELGHGRHGLIAGNEIVASNCAGNPRDVTDWWAEQDKVYDRETRHGETQGVQLPD